VTSKATKEQLQRFAGEYLANRMSYTTFMKAAALAGVTRIGIADSGALTATVAGETMRLVPVDSLLFRDVTSGEPVAFRADGNGRITHAFVGMVPMMTWEKRTGLASPTLHLVVLALFVWLGWAAVRGFRSAR
jgi:hypothetical protein